MTNHDVKAIEYIIKEKMDTLGLDAYKEFVHFGLTSQDINNTAIPLSLKEAHDGGLLPRRRGGPRASSASFAAAVARGADAGTHARAARLADLRWARS